MKMIFMSACLALAACSRPESNSSVQNNWPVNSSGIVHGESVSQVDQLGKSVVALVMNTSEGQGLCTGTLIAEDMVLTAAHCVDHGPYSIAIVFDTHVKGSSGDRIRYGDNYAQHPLWFQAAKEGDLALIHFSSGLVAGYVPVQLGSVQLAVGESVLMMGFGVTNGTKDIGAGTLRETQTSILGQKSSTEIVSDGRQSSVCFGDSGGPAFVQTDAGYVQWGVASAVGNQACDSAIIHTSLRPYLSWIRAAAAELRKN